MFPQTESPAERRRYKRFPVNLLASIKVFTSTATLPFKIKEVNISDVSYHGCGILVTTESEVTQEDLSKLFTRRRKCNIYCRFPNFEQTSALFGEIAWVEPRITSNGTRIRFGIDLEETSPGELGDLKHFIDGLQNTSPEQG